MTFDFSIKTPSGNKNFSVGLGDCLLFIGANGGGKTRLAVQIENKFVDRAHRISAHRALNLNPSVAKISEQDALRGLRAGNVHKSVTVAGNRIGSRWNNKAETSLLNDFNFLVQALFANQSNISLVTHQQARARTLTVPTQTNMEKLVEVWDRILPHRKLHISGDDITVSANDGASYTASDMSDGERAVFYLIGQTLVAAPNSLIIFDEPELHIHRSILSRLWDELEATRDDCAFVIISHDLEFVASRNGQKFFLRSYSSVQGWDIEDVPVDTGFTEEMTALILGSRKPVLFVEGDATSLDLAVYRACYPEWSVISRNSCEEVIHAVTTMRANAQLTRITCAGLVDADDRTPKEIEFLDGLGIAILPVSEIENLFLLPEVLASIARFEGHVEPKTSEVVNRTLEELFQSAARPDVQDTIIIQYCRRRIDRMLKKVDLSNSSDIGALKASFDEQTRAVNIDEIEQLIKDNLADAITRGDAHKLLKWYGNKGILAIACKAKNTTKLLFEQWVVRAMRNDSAPDFKEAIRQFLPVIHAY